MGEKMSRNPYVQRLPKTTWFFRQPRYMRYMAREVTCLFIFAYSLFLVWALLRLSQGPEAYEAFLAALRSPVGIVSHLVMLGVAIYHSISWFSVTPQAMRIQKGEDFVPGETIVRGHYIVWGVVSFVVLLLAEVL
jgi:fumarate reductase subunit C